MKPADRLIPNPPAGLRERKRADGSTRLWWEPSAAARALGFAVVELDEQRLTWTRREADRLNRELAAAQKTGRRAAPSAGGRSIEALIEQYRKSRLWKDLAEKTRKSYDGNFRLIIRKWGPHQVRDFDKPAMRAWYETLVDEISASSAVARLRAMSLLMSYAEMIGWRPENTNPCLRLKMTTPRPRRRAADWSEVDQLVATADRIGLPSIGTAILLSLLQGQRQTDIWLARVGDFTTRTSRAGGVTRQRIQWTITRSKRGNTDAMWLHADVQDRVAALIAGANDPASRLLRDEVTGGPYDEQLLARRWRKVRAAAIEADKSGRMKALAGLQFRDLRRTFGILSRSGGATKDDTGDVLGNSAATNPQLADTYMPAQLDTASRAVDAIKRPTRLRKGA